MKGIKARVAEALLAVDKLNAGTEFTDAVSMLFRIASYANAKIGFSPILDIFL